MNVSLMFIFSGNFLFETGLLGIYSGALAREARKRSIMGK